MMRTVFTTNIKDSSKINFIGRVRSARIGKKVSFLMINDGSISFDVQIVVNDQTNNRSIVNQIRTGAIVQVEGIVKLTKDRLQDFEVSASNLILLDNVDQNYPLQKKQHSPEFLREISYLRVRTKTFQSIFKIRSQASFAIHKFFIENNFVYVNSPIITENDAEGAGESFVVTTRIDNKYEKDFFGKKATLTVSGQLNAEALAQGLGFVYTFGPTFRAENSNTSRHAAEFWMIEPEMAFKDLNFNIEIIEAMIKSVVNHVLKKCQNELLICEKHYKEQVITKLNNVINSEFAKITYSEVIKILNKAVKNGVKFENNDIKFGMDLGSEHERYICEKHFSKPVFVINYPKEIKAFYMKLNQDNKTVAACDLLVPQIGELVGGSQREDDYDKLIQRCNELKINVSDLSWYLNLRKYGYYKSSGFGLGFERLIMYLTGATNIRDVIPFPRTPKNLLF